MPASGGGLEIAPDLIGDKIQLFGGFGHWGLQSPPNLRRALYASSAIPSLTSYSAKRLPDLTWLSMRDLDQTEYSKWEAAQ